MSGTGTWEFENRLASKDRSRTRLLRVSPTLLLDLLVRGKPATQVVSGLPDDARIVGSHFYVGDRDIALRIWSASFDQVAPGQIAPDIEVYHQAISQAHLDGPIRFSGEVIAKLYPVCSAINLPWPKPTLDALEAIACAADREDVWAKQYTLTMANNVIVVPGSAPPKPNLPEKPIEQKIEEVLEEPAESWMQRPRLFR